MLFLLMEEDSGQAGAMGPILEFVVMENVMERLFVWSLRREFTDDMKLEQLKMYEMLVGQARQPLLHHKPILRPLMMLLSSCSGTAAPQVEAELVLLLNQLCCVLAKDPSILELFFHTSEDQGATNFLIFSLLIPFIHREGTVGQQARDALLLIMALSAENERVAKHVAENTYFCPVLATGLSGLYSSLPTKLEVPNEEWHCLHKEDWLKMPSLVQFLNSLEFCNAVIQVAHPDIRDQLVGYIYNGFLVPVLAPALHKLTLEEVMTTTAYLDLFLRSVTEPALLQTFLSFILLHRHESVHILDTLVSRINTPFQLGTVSLALFRTLIGLYCEDVMLQLVLRYLIPCNHMMLSQRRVVRERDCYSVSAAKILALTPSCCSPDRSPPPLRQLDSILFSKGAETPNSTRATVEANLHHFRHALHSESPIKRLAVTFFLFLYAGPFVSVLLSRMENMLSNSLHVNLLLTGILAQLAAYPQPLLRSFLLNTNLVFQPTVRSLYQVLATVKHQIEEQAASRKDFPELITAAQHWLLARETSFMAAGDNTPTVLC
uniref:FHF complex subunit HOOK interacting protein 1A n=1 Tax=Sparus aurata TaxID=8175 RepID=A0A671YXU8_SPAAU